MDQKNLEEQSNLKFSQNFTLVDPEINQLVHGNAASEWEGLEVLEPAMYHKAQRS